MNKSTLQPTLNTTFSCILCSKKIFNSKRGFNIHNTRIHKLQNRISNSSVDNLTLHTRVFCTLCTRKSFKNKQGLIRHERYSHNTYNIPCANLISLPEEAINEFKRTIVYLIQRQLSNHSRNQQTAVILFIPTQTDQEIDDNMKDSGCNTFSQDQNAAKFEIKVKWERRELKDTINHKCTGGFLILKFTTDTAFF
ncbi:hypothetical protein F8M41_020607 [Gigaspora margarita]|uniref:C2H2-type domain-containing protein n=1 Tax=Gigaspora margarita TaxID=4874 RepID=A0A8H4AI94_GIGMA|nr:hypothetical protein F8M41_020607 [Gigaspora margarita]